MKREEIKNILVAKKSQYVLQEEKHEYVNAEGVKAKISVTQLLTKVGLGVDFSMVSERVLSAKAERGTDIHKTIEDVDKYGFAHEGEKVSAVYAEEYEKLGMDCLASEYTVNDGEDICGTIDKLYWKDGGIVLADIKTTANIEPTAYLQCNILRELLRRMIPELREEKITLMLLHITDDKAEGEVQGIKIEKVLVPDINILPIVDSSTEDKTYEMEAYLDRNALVVDRVPDIDIEKSVTEVTDTESAHRAAVQIGSLVRFIKQMTELKDAVLGNLKAYMSEEQIRSIKTIQNSITLVEGREEMTFDSAKFRKENAELYAKYKTKKKTVGSYLTVK